MTLIADALTIAVYGVATVLLLAALDKHLADGHQGIAGTPTPPPRPDHTRERDDCSCDLPGRCPRHDR